MNRHSIVATFLVVLGTPLCSAAVIHVDDDAALGGDGVTWNTAYRYLQDGLAAAQAGDEIRVAQGTYRPDQDEAGLVTPGDRAATFELVNTVGIYGGYAGLGAADSDERDIELYETVLSGDLAGDDGPNFVNYDENSYHVIVGVGCDETSIVDGVTIQRGNANGSSPDNSGGGMYNTFSSGGPTLAHCTFTANLAVYGGGLANLEYGNMTLRRCTLSGNSATRGGGMYNSWASPTLVACDFSENTAEDGAGMLSTHSTVELAGCTFSGNSAVYDGGGMLNEDDSWAALNTCTFSGNSAWSGGGMFNIASRPTLAYCTFLGNSAWGGGGGIANDNSYLSVTRCEFSGNSAPGGGGMSNNGGGLAVTDTVFSGNAADSGGGGVYNAGSCELTMTHCAISWNSASQGGGMLSEFSSPTLMNCAFLCNSSASSGGGLESGLLSDATLTSCTFVGNWAEDHGGGIYSRSGSPTLTNCILWGDEPDELYVDTWSTPTVGFSDIEGGIPPGAIDGGGNINLPPLFVAGPAGCYYLSQTAAGLPVDSPCLNAGSDSAVNVGLDGKTTRRDEVGDAGIVDMGYHYPVTGLPFIRGDFDRDGDVDPDDFTEWAAQLTGPCATPPCWPPAYPDPCGNIADDDDDGDVDLTDFRAFQHAFGA